jgi:hypothetical protein
MYTALYAGACRDLATAAFLWDRYPRYARALAASAWDVIAELPPRPDTSAIANFRAGGGEE